MFGHICYPYKPVAKHSGLAQALAADIAAGRFAVGTLLPTELELCRRHGASRYAVRLALAQLHEMGLISRRKNVGTRVEAARPRAGFHQALASVEDLAQFGATHQRQVHDVQNIVADLALAAELGCAGGTRWLRISSLRVDAAGLPVAWTDAYIDAAYADIGQQVQAHPGTLISSLIEQQHGRRIARIQQDIEAVAVPVALAGPLQVDAGSPALKVLRRYLDDADVAFELTLSMHPAQRFKFSMELQRAREQPA